MRLRLRIVRNDLPPVNTLWPLSETQQKNTISQLLEKIDQTFPLAISNRGLEEYAVEIAGYECLHYYEIGAVCKDEDEVVIRPLTLAEVRSRHITGRSQIEEGGRKLHDGVAFGRPLLTAPVRPTVKVRKRKRNDADDGEEERRVRFATEHGRDEGAPLGSHTTVITIGDHEDDEDDEDDEDFEDDVESGAATSASSSSSTSDSSSVSTSSQSSDSSSDSSSDDSSNVDSSSDDSSSEDSSSDDSSSDDSSSDESSEASAKLRPKPRDKQAEPKRSSNQNESAKRSENAQKGITNTAQFAALPHAGKPTTKSRNIRRRDSKKLAWLKAQNILPPNADLKAAREWQGTVPWSEIDPSSTTRGESMDTSSVTLNGGDGKEASEAGREADLAARREMLLQSLASGGIELRANGNAVEDEEMDIDEGPEVQSNKVAAENAALTAQLYQESINNQAAKDATDRRRLDMSSAERLLYGSLGVRAPKTKEQRDATQKKLASRFGTAAPKVKSTKQPEQPAEEEDNTEVSDDWRSKIDLRAVECVEEGVQLCTPPFPFYKRWDPAYHGHSKKKNRNMSAYAEAPRKRRRRNDQGATAVAYEEVYDKYNKDGTGDALDYDGDGGGGDDSYWEEGALLGDEDEYYEDDLAEKQLLNEANAELPVDDFPPLPSDPSTLTALASSDARAGDYVVYTEMVCSPATKWQPQMLLRTVKLLKKEEGIDAWKTLLALRDLPPKEYDEDGMRVYGKFEMAGMSDDEGDGEEEDERIKVLLLGDLMEVKLLKRGDEAVE
ncbi:hypothetical protein Q7P37_004739 [Cladosporium fusiforme]